MTYRENSEGVFVKYIFDSNENLIDIEYSNLNIHDIDINCEFIK